MPKQETFLHQDANGVVIEVVKTYDKSYAREVFAGAGEQARKALAAALELDSNHEPADIPDPDANDYDDFLWGELCEAAREDVRQSPVVSSFFVVTETRAGKAEDLYVSPDWPSAETFARSRIATAQ